MNPSTQVTTRLTLLLRLWGHLSQRRKFQFWLLVGLMLITAFLEMISLGAVLPFLGILIVPKTVFDHPIVQMAVPTFGITSADQLVLPLTITFVIAALIAGTFRILLLRLSIRIAFAYGADLGSEIYRRTLYQPYPVHVARNSSKVISNITYKVDSVVFEVLQPFLTLISAFVLLIAIMIVLFFIDSMVASVTIIGFGASYGLITWLARNRLQINSQRIAHEQTQLVKVLQEGLGGIRDILLDGTQSAYYDIYRKVDSPLRWAQGSNNFIQNYPRYALESLGVILITVLAYILSLKPGGLAEAMPTIGALIIGSQRVLSGLQQIYINWTRIAGTRASFVDTLALLDQSLPAALLQPDPEPLVFQSSIQFKRVSFRYTLEGPWVLDDLNFNIQKGARIGFVGNTGGGKSTTLDLMMALLTPTQGEILIDGQSINNHGVRAWQRSIAHVPQTIYLSDNTLAENIAFGTPRELINMQKVQQAAQQAQIADFIEGRPEGYQAVVGERGIRLSGGQRQRIGIARALYKQASVLVFDEATSALDNTTEKAVMSSIVELKRNYTILLIAHRISTVKHCDVIMELDHGKLVAQGTYDQLLNCSPSFKKMARTMGG